MGKIYHFKEWSGVKEKGMRIVWSYRGTGLVQAFVFTFSLFFLPFLFLFVLFLFSFSSFFSSFFSPFPPPLCLSICLLFHCGVGKNNCLCPHRLLHRGFIKSLTGESLWNVVLFTPPVGSLTHKHNTHTHTLSLSLPLSSLPLTVCVGVCLCMCMWVCTQMDWLPRSVEQRSMQSAKWTFLSLFISPLVSFPLPVFLSLSFSL